MPINADLSGLRSSSSSDEGFPPDRDDTYAREMVRAWLDHFDPDDELELAIPEAGPIRASQAGMCARAISYDIDPTLPKPPTPLADRWRFAIGKIVHQQVLGHHAETNESATAELNVDLNPIGVPGSAHADLVEQVDGRYVLTVEGKSVNGTGFKTMATRDRGAPTGPRLSYVLQGGLVGLALDVDEVRVIVWSLENAAPWHVKRHGTPRDNPEAAAFLAQWTITLDEVRPLVEREAKRLAKIAELHARGELAPRAVVDEDVPAQARITDPSTGGWELVDQNGVLVAAGETWQCGYCRWQEQCVKDLQAGR